MIELLGKIANIIDKFIPGRKEQYVNELNLLLVEYARALKDGKDTEAAIFKKRITILRRKLNYAGEDI